MCVLVAVVESIRPEQISIVGAPGPHTVVLAWVQKWLSIKSFLNARRTNGLAKLFFVVGAWQADLIFATLLFCHCFCRSLILSWGLSSKVELTAFTWPQLMLCFRGRMASGLSFGDHVFVNCHFPLLATWPHT